MCGSINPQLETGNCQPPTLRYLGHRLVYQLVSIEHVDGALVQRPKGCMANRGSQAAVCAHAVWSGDGSARQPRAVPSHLSLPSNSRP